MLCLPACLAALDLNNYAALGAALLCARYSLGALTSTSALARIFVRAAPISRPVQDGRPAVLRAAGVPWLLRHRGSVFRAAME